MFKNIIFICVLVILNPLSKAFAACQYQPKSANNTWNFAQYRPIGPASLNILAQRFQPAGTVLYDNTYSMSSLLQTSDDTILIRCSTQADALSAGASLRLDDTYQFQGFVVNGEKYYYTGYAPSSLYKGTVGYALYGVSNDGTQKPLVFSDATSPSNTGVRFPVKSYKNCSDIGTLSASECNSTPYVITAGDFPSIRLVLVRSPYDTNNTMASDKFIGRIGYFLSSTSADIGAFYGYITLASEYIKAAAPACGVTQVPNTVNLGSTSITTLASSAVSWTPFTITYECSSTNSPVSNLRIGMEPQNKNKLQSNNSKFLLPDNGGATGVGFVYRRNGEIETRYWIKNSGCNGVSTETVNNSYCSFANTQGESDGWYIVRPDSQSDSSTYGYTEYTENFESRLEILPGTNSNEISSGMVSTTVNVLVNIP